MRLCCTFPGKFGDLIWALPTVRAISRRIGEQVDLLVAEPFRSICPLIMSQPYIGKCEAMDGWNVRDTAPITPRVPPLDDSEGYWSSTYDAILHLGYRGWPMPDCVRHTLDTANMDPYFVGRPPREPELALHEPWITLLDPPPTRPASVVVGFTDEHFELKYGLLRLIERNWFGRFHTVGHNPRWWNEAGCGTGGPDWKGAAWMIAHAKVFLGCCSALHALAVAVGTPVVLVEPNEARWNPVFYPFGDAGLQVQLVRGTDGRPTWDARHVADALRARLESKTWLERANS